MSRKMKKPNNTATAATMIDKLEFMPDLRGIGARWGRRRS
jgi:hypothetical protein